MLIEGWVVKYLYYGEERKFLTLEKSRAIEYAAQHKGTYHPLSIPEIREAKNEDAT